MWKHGGEKHSFGIWHVLRISRISGWESALSQGITVLNATFLIVLKTLESKILPLLYHAEGPGGVLQRTWQHLSWSLLLFKCTLPCGVPVRHTSGCVAHFQGRSLWAIQVFLGVWFTDHRSPSELWGWNSAGRDELLIEFPNACSTNQAKAAMCFCKENLPYMNLFNIAVLLVMCKKRTMKYFLLLFPVTNNF